MRTLLAAALLAASFGSSAATADGCLPEARPVSGYAVHPCYSGDQNPRWQPFCAYMYLEVGGQTDDVSACAVPLLGDVCYGAAPGAGVDVRVCKVGDGYFQPACVHTRATPVFGDSSLCTP